MKLLSRPEEQVMLAIWHLHENAYLVTIREYLSRKSGKEWTVGAIYVPLDRITKMVYTEIRFGESTPERGGRRKKYYKLTKTGLSALSDLQKVHAELWKGVPRIDGNGEIVV